MKRYAVPIGCVAIASLLYLNYSVLSKVGHIQENLQEQSGKIEDIQKDLNNVKKDVQLVKSIVYDSQDQVNLTKREQECLARNIFFEAGVESYEGKLAVAQVTLNRAKTKRWGSNICDVVFARKQFSWTLDKKKRNQSPKGRLWKDSIKAKQDFLKGKRVVGLDKSKHYHTDYIKQPVWAEQKKVAAVVGQHIFYEN